MYSRSSHEARKCTKWLMIKLSSIKLSYKVIIFQKCLDRAFLVDITKRIEFTAALTLPLRFHLCVTQSVSLITPNNLVHYVTVRRLLMSQHYMFHFTR